MSDLKVIIAGCRYMSDYMEVASVMALVQEWGSVIAVISGCAKGADVLGITWAHAHQIPVEEYPANWKKHGKAAGPMRNSEMVKNGNVLVAFPSSKSVGTLDIIQKAAKARLRVLVWPIP